MDKESAENSKPDLGLTYVVSDKYLLEALHHPTLGSRNAQTLAFNKYLTEDQCRVVNSFVKMDIYKSFLMKNPNYPADLLHSEALAEPSWFLAEAIMSQPKTLDESKVALVLQGNIRPIYYSKIEEASLADN